MNSSSWKKAGAGYFWNDDAGAPAGQPSERLKKAVFYGLLFFSIFIPFRSPLADFTFSGIKILTDLVILGLFVWYSVEIRFRYRLILPDLVFLAFLAFAFVSTVLVNRVGLFSYLYEVRALCAYYLFFFVARNMGFGRQEFLKLVRLLQGVMYVLFALGVIEKISSKTLLFPASRASTILYASNFTRVYSMLYNPNTYGLFLALTLLFTWVARLCFEKKSSVFFYVALFFSLWLSMSRSTMIIVGVMMLFFLGLLLYTGKGRELRRPVLCTGAVVLVSVVLLHYGVSFGTNLYFRKVLEPSLEDQTSSDVEDDPLSKLEQTLDQNLFDRLHSMTTDKEMADSNAEGRLFSLKTSLKVAADYPLFGAGFGSYGSAASLNRPSPIAEKYGLPKGFYADLQYASILAETGIPGLLLFLGFLATVLLRYRRDCLKLAVCFAIGWFGLFYNIFEVQIGAMLCWSFLAFERFPLPAGRRKKEGETDDFSGEKVREEPISS